MSIKKVSTDKWFVRLRHRQNGKVIGKKLYVTGSREDAMEAELKLRKEFKQKSNSASCSLKKIDTFGEALRYYRERTNKDLYRIMYIFKRLEETLGSVRIGELGTRFGDFWDLLQKERAQRTGMILSPVTINNYLYYAKLVLNFALERDLIARNPLAAYKKLSDEGGRNRVLTDDETLRLLNVLSRRNSYLYWPAYFSLKNPIRRGDLFRLTRENLDLFKPWVHFYPRKTRKRKPRETCLVFFDDALIGYFKSLPNECPYLFPRIDNKGNWHMVGEFKRHWDSIRQEAGLVDFHWHDLKHCAITWMLDNGYIERDLKNLGIQYSPKMIDLYYKHDAEKVLRKWKKNNAAVVAPGVAPEKQTSFLVSNGYGT